MSETLKNQAVKGVFWSFVERFSLYGVQFVIGVILARLLSPKDFGIIGMLAVFMSISQVFIDGGFSSALIQRKNREEIDFSTVFYINLIVSILCYLLLYLTAPYISKFYNEPILLPLTRIYSLNLIINSFVAVNKTKLVINLDFKTQSKITFICACLSGLLGVIFAYNGFAVWALVIQMLTNSILNVIITFYYVRWLPLAGFSSTSFRSLFSFGSKLLIASLISNVYRNLYNLVIGKKFDASVLGYYTRADQFVQLLSNNVAAILAKVSFPLFSKIQNDDERLINIYSKYIQISAFIVFPLVLGLGGVATPLIRLLLTDKWLESAVLLKILSFAYFWDCIILVNLNLLKVKGRSDLLLKLEVRKKTIAFCILFITLFFNIKVICLGLVVYSIIALYMNTYYTKKILNYGLLQQLREILPYVLFSLIVFIEASVISYTIVTPLYSILLSIAVCSITYLCLCYSIKSMPLMLAVSFLKNRRS